MNVYFTYILASRPRGTLYIGVTNSIIRRVMQHRAGEGSEFTRRYRVHMLVWYAEFHNVSDAIQREIDQKVDFAKMEQVLMEEGLKKFADPQKGLIAAIAEKRAKL